MTLQDFKNDLKSGKITELALLENDIEVIRNNTYAYITNVWRKVVKITDDYFELETQNKDGSITNCEAYYGMFDEYTGETLKGKGAFYICR